MFPQDNAEHEELMNKIVFSQQRPGRRHVTCSKMVDRRKRKRWFLGWNRQMKENKGQLHCTVYLTKHNIAHCVQNTLVIQVGLLAVAIVNLTRPNDATR